VELVAQPSRHREILDDCLDGLLKEEKRAVHYKSSTGMESDYTLCPYTLVAFKRGLQALEGEAVLDMHA